MEFKELTLEDFKQEINIVTLKFKNSIFDKKYNKISNPFLLFRTYLILIIILIAAILARIIYYIINDIYRFDLSLYAGNNAPEKIIMLIVFFTFEIGTLLIYKFRILKGFFSIIYFFVMIAYTPYTYDGNMRNEANFCLPMFISVLVIGNFYTCIWIVPSVACVIGLFIKIVLNHMQTCPIHEKLFMDLLYGGSYMIMAFHFYFISYQNRYNFFLSQKREEFQKSYYDLLKNLPVGLILLDLDNNPIFHNSVIKEIIFKKDNELLSDNCLLFGNNKDKKDIKKKVIKLLEMLKDTETETSLKNVIERIDMNDLDDSRQYTYNEEGNKRLYTVKGMKGIISTLYCKILILQDQTSMDKLSKLNEKYQKLYLESIIHDMRTPLNGILGMLDMIDIDIVGSENKEYIINAKKQCRVMMYFTHDIIDHNLIKTNKLRINNCPTDIAKYANEAFNLLKLTFSKSKISHSLEVGPDVPKIVNIDKDRYMQILLNLLGNALKYTFEGEISVSIIYSDLKEIGRAHV